MINGFQILRPHFDINGILNEQNKNICFKVLCFHFYSNAKHSIFSHYKWVYKLHVNIYEFQVYLFISKVLKLLNFINILHSLTRFRMHFSISYFKCVCINDRINCNNNELKKIQFNLGFGQLFVMMFIWFIKMHVTYNFVAPAVFYLLLRLSVSENL